MSKHNRKRENFSHITVPEGAKLIPLTKGKYALVDEEDFERVNRHSWHSHTKDNKWKVQICVNGKTKHVGYFENEIEAAKVYDAKAKELFGEFAYINFK